MVGPSLDIEAVERWLGRTIKVEGQASTGSSNITWFVRIDDTPAVLRQPPPGPTLPTAHDLAREHRYLTALAGSAVPVPTPIAFCQDLDVIGAPFLIMTRMDGVCLLGTDYAIPDPEGLARRAVETLAAIHSVDWQGAGMSAPPGRYLVRQIRRWREQLSRTPTAGRLGDLDAIHDWLVDNLPAEEDTTIVHGDFGFHNLLVQPGDGAVTAVLDWELATLGDPLSDVMSFAKGWGKDAQTPNPANRSFESGGWKAQPDQLIAWYGACTGRSFGANRQFYEVFGRWRTIGITEGIHARSNGARFVSEVPRLVDDTMALIGH